MKNTAIILGGGIGKRFQGDIPKQFLLLDKRPMIVHTVEAFEHAPSIDAIVVVVPEGWEQRCSDELKPFDMNKLKGIITGGETRQLSCWQALHYLAEDPPSIVVIHDAARPLVTGGMIEQAVREGTREGTQGMTFGLPVTDTVVESRDGQISSILPREELRQVQTPQAFPFQTLWEAHRTALEEGIRDASDDAGLVLRMGRPVRVIEGDPRNIKITGPADLELAQHLLREGQLPS
jgi:2-C-methyl-D-erythritol 4-phosphate cytidylyltransferase